MKTALTRREIIAGLGAAAVGGTLLGRAAKADAEAGKPPAPIVRTFEFSRNSGGMLAGFSDYNLAVAGLNCVAELRALPHGLAVPGRNRNAYYLAGVNRSDDLFMFLKAVLTAADGIVASQAYKVAFDIQFASRSNNCPGAGGDESAVWLKAGGSPLEPVTLLAGQDYSHNYLTISVDKGHQGNGGKDVGVIGSIWNGIQCPQSTWVMLRKTYTHPTPIVATPEQQLWIVLGTESGYESLTEVYYHSIRVQLTPF